MEGRLARQTIDAFREVKQELAKYKINSSNFQRDQMRPELRHRDITTDNTMTHSMNRVSPTGTYTHPTDGLAKTSDENEDQVYSSGDSDDGQHGRAALSTTKKLKNIVNKNTSKFLPFEALEYM